ncbi:MAG TPA: filamentous hemagglutinin N-terminal domain-containing protein, partial [Oculatellaceae cyanobacterium]
IREGRGAYFTNPAGIENILSRVTGTNPSNILGTLGVLGNANLFLINPNGIVFGPKAKLDVGGSFVASTSSTVRLVDGTEFSATNPSAFPLLTVSIPVGLQYRGNEGSIQVQGGLNSQLSVPNGETLALVGGTVNLDSAILLAPGGRVELGGLAGTGTVGLNIDGNDLRLSFPDGVTRSDVSISNKTVVTVAAGGGGSIAVNVRNLALLEGSTFLGGIEERSRTAGSIGGDITINATEEIKVEKSGIFADVPPQSVGKAGAINITTGSLYLTNGARVSSSTRGQGDAGRVTITARDTIAADGVSLNGFSGGVFSSIGPGSVGTGGSVEIVTGSLSLTNGAQVTAATRGQGDAGSVTITARDTLVFDGVGSNRSSSGAFSTVSYGGVGKGGDVNVTTGSLSLTNGAEVSASTFGQGDAGTVTIIAREAIASDGVGSNGFSSGAFSYVGASAVGNGGNVNVTTGSLSLTNGALVSASTFGRGNAGNVTILATGILDFDGFSSRDFSSGVSSLVGLGATGNGGDIKITTSSLSLTD